MGEHPTYCVLADEYYDQTRHPTCANFRYASAILLRRWLPRLLKRVKRACEVGAGGSILAEVLMEMGRCDALRHLVITDASARMLAHSLRWAEYGAVLECAEASDLPHADGWFDLVVAAAGDPYNDSRTWKEISRVLRRGGFCIFTTPAYQWSVKFRRLTSGDMNSAEFELRSGARISVPSFIYPRERQEYDMRKAGLYTLKYEIIEVGDIEGQRISPKLLLNAHSAVMEGYFAIKRQGVGGDLASLG
jgi:SAM-dependent methyltransferase